MLSTCPASRSAWVVTCVAVHVMVAPGAKRATGTVGEHEPTAALLSVIVAEVIVTLPMFVVATV